VTEDNRSKIEMAIPKNKNMPRNLNDLDKLSKAHNLKAEGFNYSKDGSSKSGRINTYFIDLTLQGEYKDFLEFLNSIDKSIELYNIKSLDVTNSTDDFGTNNFSYRVQLETFENK
jgi:Tfp pilus assembly protein PilO